MTLEAIEMECKPCILLTEINESLDAELPR